MVSYCGSQESGASRQEKVGRIYSVISLTKSLSPFSLATFS
ncbi:hypothetical protein N0824_03090 [Microcystis sp. 0824]|nr:hypothetical protein N0824_03090 [Microcystis sp. 0824]